MLSPQPFRLAVCKPALFYAQLFFTLFFLGKGGDGNEGQDSIKGLSI